MNISPYFMTAESLAFLRSLAAKQRAQRDLRRALRQHGWSDSACAELAQIHVNLKPQQPTSLSKESRHA